MAADDRRERIWNLAEPLAAELGLELVDVEVAGTDRTAVVRVFVDKGADGRAVSIDDCETVSRRLGDILDAHEEGAGRYQLEISSPGINRRLRKPEHFSRVIGERVRIRTDHKIDGRRNFLGRPVAANGETGTLDDDEGGGAMVLPLAAIERANYEHDFAGEGGKKR